MAGFSSRFWEAIDSEGKNEIYKEVVSGRRMGSFGGLSIDFYIFVLRLSPLFLSCFYLVSMLGFMRMEEGCLCIENCSCVLCHS